MWVAPTTSRAPAPATLCHASGLREVAYGSQKLVVENTCFYAGNRARIDDERDVKRGLCKYPGSWRDYLEKLGVVGRDTAVHPWGE